MFKLARRYQTVALVSAPCGNMAEEVYNYVIVNRRFGLLFLKYRFRHCLGTGIVLKSIGLAPVSF